MIKTLQGALALLFLVAGVAWGQASAPVAKPPPTAEELAFARLAPDIQAMLGHLTAAQAMQTVAQAGQHAIALGIPTPTPEQFRTTLGALLNSPYSTYTSASAGATSFPPLSPLVAPPPPPPYLR